MDEKQANELLQWMMQLVESQKAQNEVLERIAQSIDSSAGNIETLTKHVNNLALIIRNK